MEATRRVVSLTLVVVRRRCGVGTRHISIQTQASLFQVRSSQKTNAIVLDVFHSIDPSSDINERPLTASAATGVASLI